LTASAQDRHQIWVSAPARIAPAPADLDHAIPGTVRTWPSAATCRKCRGRAAELYAPAFVLQGFHAGCLATRFFRFSPATQLRTKRLQDP